VLLLCARFHVRTAHERTVAVDTHRIPERSDDVRHSTRAITATPGIINRSFCCSRDHSRTPVFPYRLFLRTPCVTVRARGRRYERNRFVRAVVQLAVRQFLQFTAGPFPPLGSIHFVFMDSSAWRRWCTGKLFILSSSSQRWIIPCFEPVGTIALPSPFPRARLPAVFGQTFSPRFHVSANLWRCIFNRHEFSNVLFDLFLPPFISPAKRFVVLFCFSLGRVPS
jgi:hypothetical protein